MAVGMDRNNRQESFNIERPALKKAKMLKKRKMMVSDVLLNKKKG